MKFDILFGVDGAEDFPELLGEKGVLILHLEHLVFESSLITSVRALLRDLHLVESLEQLHPLLS